MVSTDTFMQYGVLVSSVLAIVSFMVALSTSFYLTRDSMAISTVAWFAVVIFLSISVAISVHTESEDRKECKTLGGERTYIGEEEGYGCIKEYTSCGPDESKPGYTICEQKFKRVYPEGGV